MGLKIFVLLILVGYLVYTNTFKEEFDKTQLVLSNATVGFIIAVLLLLTLTAKRG